MSASQAKREVKLRVALTDQDLAKELDLVIEEVGDVTIKKMDGTNITL